MLATTDLDEISRTIRQHIISASFKASTPHIGSALSCVDILTSVLCRYLTIKGDENDDVLLLSKGHAALALYATLHVGGIIPRSVFDTFACNGSVLPEHPIGGICPGIRVTSGSLGHGIGIGLGIAKAMLMKHQNRRVVVVMSDGECNEGSVWEAALLAPKLEASNLTVIIDYNKWQATGKTNEILALAPLEDKWQAFGWDTYLVDGHDCQSLTHVLQKRLSPNKPKAIIANTIKGRGIRFMEDDNNWHYKLLDKVTYQEAMDELCVMPLLKQ